MGTSWRAVCLFYQSAALFPRLGPVRIVYRQLTLLQPASWRTLDAHIGRSTMLRTWPRERSRMRGGHCWSKTSSRPIRKSFARRRCAVIARLSAYASTSTQYVHSITRNLRIWLQAIDCAWRSNGRGELNVRWQSCWRRSCQWLMRVLRVRRSG